MFVCVYRTRVIKNRYIYSYVLNQVKCLYVLFKLVHYVYQHQGHKHLLDIYADVSECLPF